MKQAKCKYPLRPELNQYAGVQLPVQPAVLRAANLLMPLVQRGRRLPDGLTETKIALPNCPASLLTPKTGKKDALLLYCHGGAFVMKAAAYHKNLAQDYALGAGCPVLSVDYRLAPRYPFPLPVQDCCDAYRWAAVRGYRRIILGGDSAGANLALAVLQSIHRDGALPPAGAMLVYPVADARMETDSMKRFTDTPMWNSVSNRAMYSLYAKGQDLHNPLISPMEAERLAFVPAAYVETAEFDCLHDEGVALAARLREEGAAVTLNETRGTIHGYDIAENAPYVRAQVEKRIGFLKGLLEGHAG